MCDKFKAYKTGVAFFYDNVFARDSNHMGIPRPTFLLLGGNFYQSKPEAGIYDASYGLPLKGDGKGGLAPLPAQQSGLVIKGQVRDISALRTKAGSFIIFARNNEKAV